LDEYLIIKKVSANNKPLITVVVAMLRL